MYRGLCLEERPLTDAYLEVLEETRRHLARVEGELASVRDQLAASSAAEAQLRKELEASREEGTIAVTELAHTQREREAHETILFDRIKELQDDLAEARRVQREAEHERAAVIASLGRRARRHLD
jgi:septal ring factor EnvC (AmiA/AmiB activator)